MNAVGWQSVPVQELRAWFRERAAQTSLGVVAEEAGIGKSTLAAFISHAERRPIPRTRRILALFYLQGTTGMPQFIASALESLTDALPPGHRRDVTENLLATLSDGYRRAGMQPPPWSVQ